MASNFVDYVKIYCRSGKGGRGSTHMRRVKYNPNGGPDGGNGGRGGSMTPTDHVNGKEAAKEWFAKNKEELAKKNVSVEQVRDMARKVYMNNKKPDSYFYEVNRYGWRGKKLRDYNLDL